MKTALWILGGGLLLLLAAVLALQVDDELSPQAAAMLDNVSVEGDSRAYRYLMGIFASADDDPSEVGERLITDIRDAQRRLDTPSIEGLNYPRYPEHRKLALPQGERFCRWADPGCIEQVFSEPASIPATLNLHGVLLKRYHEFLTLDDYRTLTTPGADEPFPPFRYLQAGGRLLLLKAIHEAEQGNKTLARDMLATHLSAIRHQLVKQDMQLGKIVLLSLFSETLDVAAVLSRESECHTMQVATLNQAEKSVESALSRDFWGFHNSFQSLDGDGSFFHVGAKTPGWLVRLLFKPTMTTNELWRGYKQALSLSFMSASDFSDALAQDNTITLETSHLRNYAGNALLGVATEDYRDFIAAFHDLDAKIRLFNAFNGCQAVKPDVVQNPYYQEFSPAFWSGEEARKNTSVCFSGPLADNRRMRCLRLHR